MSVTKDEIIRVTLERISFVLDDDFHGCRSEVWSSVSLAIDKALSDQSDEVESLRQDAERFRWLCSQSDVCLHVPGQGFTNCDRSTIDDSAAEDATWLLKGESK